MQHTDTDPAIFDAYQRLLIAVLVRAWDDAHGRIPAHREGARDWIRGAGALSVCDWLGLPVETLRERVGGIQHR